MDDLNVAIRLKGFIETEGLTHSQFADRCGIPRPSLSQLLSGRNKKISDVLIGQIHKAFPRLSVLWLLFGEGPMIEGDGVSGDSSGCATGGLADGASGLGVGNPQAVGMEGGGGVPGAAGEASYAETGSAGVKNPCENPGFSSNQAGQNKFSNVSGLNTPAFVAQSLENKQEELGLKLAELQKQIDKMKKNPRKVSHITVYYDDSTFETFYPKG